ncbi:sulfotransferase domain-containing protein [Alteromonas sp. 5E99-2]|uniref:sulfotransferase domain-containing protein n=1 Tax=Alteromonas sp. 5E99-2 TaxID=2817683 RepID=UPI001A995375|nr:sulfotransferase domain-containing protein [Alteromonas sp. 5E99-2]
MINLHILGVQKAGTSALASFLDQHPDIYVVDGKEAHIFDHPTFHKQANKARQARLKYDEKLSNYQGEPIICDATPITLFREHYLKQCIEYNQNAKFIVILRNPLDRAISHYTMSKQRGVEKRTMLMAFLLEPFRLFPHLKVQSWPFDSPARHFSYLSRGFYQRQLKRLYQSVPHDNVFVCHQASLQNEHSQTLNQLFDFLSLTPVSIPQETVFKSTYKRGHWSDCFARLYAKCVFFLIR